MTNISTSTMCSLYPLQLITDLEPNSPGWCWSKLKYHVMGLTDLRCRSGEFTTPWNATSPYRQILPDLTIPETRTLADLIDSRANEIYNNAQKLNKKIMIMWSGGIDSTTVIISLLKAIPANQHKDILSICMTSDSLIENFFFYKNFISPSKIPIVHKLSVDFSDTFLNDYILLHGDPADALFGSGSIKFRPLLEDEKYLLPYKDNMRLIYSLGNLSPNSWNFLVDKITLNLEQTNLDQIVTIADWFWWQYINFKWEGSLWRPFHGAGLRKDHTSSISKDNTITYLENTFFNTESFQRWSYTNIHNFYPGGIVGHKQEIKNYIFEFDRNSVYRKHKTKSASLPIDLINDVEDILWERPVYYDENWTGHTLQDPEVYSSILTQLQDYKG